MAALKQRMQAIESCIQWVDSIGQSNCELFSPIINLDKISFKTRTDTRENETTATIGSSSSYCPPMVGVFAKESIQVGEVIMTVSQDCVVHESHPLLVDIARDAVDKSMTVYTDTITAQYSQDRYKHYSPWDPYAKQKQKGRVFCVDELRLALHITLLLFSHELQKELHAVSLVSSAAASNLTRAARHWKHYLDTLPHSYDSLIFHWTQDEIDNLQGTSCHSLVQRLRTEMDENWDQCFRDVLEDYLLTTLESTDDVVEIDRKLLQTCYRRAICTIYSRMHALDTAGMAESSAQKNSRCTCPLIDLINGDREGSLRCNTHLLHFPGTHVVLQASRDIAAGEEVMFSYGQVSNQIFVSKFGFLPLSENANDDSKPCVDPLDAVHMLPPQHLVWEEADPRWSELTSDRSGSKALERSHLIENPPYVTAQVGTPFALFGDKLSISKVRSSLTEWRPHYLNNIHLYAVLSLTTKEALDEAMAGGENIVIEPWEPGSIILEMIDYRLQQLPTSSLAEDVSLLKSQQGNMRTGTLYRMLEREILQMWRHSIARHYDCYGETDSKGNIYKPLSENEGDKEKPSMCATCHASCAGPLKGCTQCKVVYYCSRTCQKEDWKAGHKEACKKPNA